MIKVKVKRKYFLENTSSNQVSQSNKSIYGKLIHISKSATLFSIKADKYLNLNTGDHIIYDGTVYTIESKAIDVLSKYILNDGGDYAGIIDTIYYVNVDYIVPIEVFNKVKNLLNDEDNKYLAYFGEYEISKNI